MNAVTQGAIAVLFGTGLGAGLILMVWALPRWRAQTLVARRPCGAWTASQAWTAPSSGANCCAPHLGVPAMPDQNAAAAAPWAVGAPVVPACPGRR